MFKISLNCMNPLCKYECCLSRTDSDEAKKSNRPAVLTSRVAGLGRENLDTFTAGLELLSPLRSLSHS